MEDLKRIPSNRMPAYQPPKASILGLVACALFLLLAVWTTGGAWLVSFVAIGAIFGAIFVPVSLFLEYRKRSRLGPPSICDFARSFDVRQCDTWVVRAVFEAVSELCSVRFLAASKLQEDLGLDGDELEDIALNVAQRTGRDINSATCPAFTGSTVGDLVAWFQALPAKPDFRSPAGPNTASAA